MRIGQFKDFCSVWGGVYFPYGFGDGKVVKNTHCTAGNGFTESLSRLGEPSSGMGVPLFGSRDCSHLRDTPIAREISECSSFEVEVRLSIDSSSKGVWWYLHLSW